MLCPTPPQRRLSYAANDTFLRHQQITERYLGKDRIQRAAERVARGEVRVTELCNPRKVVVTNPFRALYEQREKQRQEIDARWRRLDEEQGKAAYAKEKADRILRSLAACDALVEWKDRIRMEKIQESERIREDLERKQAHKDYIAEVKWRREEIRNRENRFLETMRNEKETRERLNLEREAMREMMKVSAPEWNCWKMLLEEIAVGYQVALVLEAQARDKLEQEKLEALRREESWNHREKYHKEKAAPKAKKSRLRNTPFKLTTRVVHRKSRLK